MIVQNRYNFARAVQILSVIFRLILIQALELLIAPHVELYNGPSRSGAFITKLSHYPGACIEFPLDFDPGTLEHVFVARLAGIDVWNPSSLGILTAVSPTGKRVALCNWKTIAVYAVQCDALLKRSELHKAALPGDHAYFEAVGHAWYMHANFDRDMLVLEPVILPEVGVVFSLQFNDDDEVWAWTDRGLARWNLNACTMHRRREMKSLDDVRVACVSEFVAELQEQRQLQWTELEDDGGKDALT
jgi:hypothetical protein